MALLFKSPGMADELSDDLLQKWNDEITRQYQSLANSEIADGVKLGSKFFKLDHHDIPGSITVNSIQWFGDPAEPAFCFTGDIAQKLSDWGIKGRQTLHNEYCEYNIIYQKDSTGKKRPKRVQITTELREYWLTLAKFNPDLLKEIASAILNRQVSWEELYGADPANMTEEEREIKFSTLVAGNGNDGNLAQKGVPSQPTGELNTANALFMSHPINGLDDLIYIVMFGAKPYARKVGDTYEKVGKESIFKTYGVQHLACRHADPTAAMGAYDAIFEGRSVAFNEYLGMYIQSFSKGSFTYNGNAIPDAWVKFSRGTEGMYQRLEFGPADSENIFLDDISVEKGGEDVNLKGGFEIVQHIEVGPRVQVGQPSDLQPEDYTLLTENDDRIICGNAEVCKIIKKLLDDYNHQGGIVQKSGQRTVKMIL